MCADVESFFADAVPAFTQGLADVESRLDPAAEPDRDESFKMLSDAICSSRDACRRIESAILRDPVLLKEAQRRFQHEIAPWFDRSWFMHRARTKPRGYPGDYELLAAIYDGQPKVRGVGGYLDLYFLNTTLGRAVPARLRAARNFLVEEVSRRRGDVSILNVACGPCREYAGGITHPDECNIRVTCIDSDQEALEYVRAHIVTVTPGISDIQCACYNALRMSSAERNVRQFGRCDIIYSVGLCDYIPDRPLVAMLQGWRDTLNDGGVLYVAFKDARRYDKTEYQWHVDWHFLQRTEEDCRNLYAQAGFDTDALEMTRDETGVIMNFISRVRSPKVFRVDLPAEEAREPARPVAVPGQKAASQQQVD